MLGDGELRGDRARKRAHLGLLASGLGRAPARDPALRIGAARARERCAAGRVRRGGHRRRQLRLPGAEGHKTGAGATLLEQPDLACRIVDAIAEAVDVPVTIKLRRGLEDGSRACLELGPRLVDAGAASLTLHPRSAQQMYTGTADHALTAELVSLVDVPVVASGDVTSRAKAQAVLASTGAAAVMVGRGAQGNPWALREIVDGDAREASREEVVAELVLFVRETVRELGDRRASSFLKKFYGWYLGGTLPEAVQAGAAPARLRRGGGASADRGGARCNPDSRAPRGRRADGRRGDARAARVDLRRRVGHASQACPAPTPVEGAEAGHARPNRPRSPRTRSPRRAPMYTVPVT